MRNVARFLLWLLRWKVDKTTPENVKKCVVVMGPHTSNWDFFIGKLAFITYGVKVKILIKKEAFVFPFGGILRSMGGVPVDRKKNNNITDAAVKLFADNETMFMLFTPEGTRSYNPNWKKGFYYIAQKAQVPIYIGYMDYERKIGGFHSLFEPTGDVANDIQHIKDILKQYKGKYPENGIK
jgi:1-acyl-sn-glycerol-3-phosphate acyltransferase